MKIWVLLFLALLMRSAVVTAAEPTVQTESGLVAGTVEDAVIVFRGIPYAAAPVGPLRWQPPAPPPSWEGARPVTTFGPSCPQPAVPPPFGAEGPQSEDCLTLNIWRPATAAAKPLPVMVWIHGGAFALGSGSQPIYDGAELARRGVVLVTFNYRLGALGFLVHPVLSRKQQGQPLGNYGLLDQIAALKWVRRNIAAFGGDPHNVTLFGESAGGVAVQALMTSPLARGLFHKAISQSGGGLTPFPDARGAAAATAGARWATAAGAEGADAAALRALPVDRILAAPFLSFPAVDGAVLPRSPGEAFARGEQTRLPFIAGANSWEGSLTIMSDALAQAALGTSYRPLLEAYTERAPSAEAARTRLRGELFFVQPARFMGRRHAATGAPTWLYHFEQVPASARGVAPGAPHGGELAYLFDTPDAALSKWDDADRRLADLLAEYWTRFAATGNPNHADAPAWEQASMEGNALRIGPVFERKQPDALDAMMEQAALAAARSDWATLP